MYNDLDKNYSMMLKSHFESRNYKNIQDVMLHNDDEIMGMLQA